VAYQNKCSDKEFKDDAFPLLDAFLYILKRNGLPNAKASFFKGIPTDDTLNFEGIERAASSKGVDLQQVTCPLGSLQAHQFPVIIFLDDSVENSVAVIESYDRHQDIYRLMRFPESKVVADANPNQTEIISAQELEAKYTGRSVLISKPELSGFEGESNDKDSMFSKWLFGEFKRLRSVYRDVFIAAIFINIFAIASPLFVMNVYDRVVPNQAMETLWVLALGVGLVLVFDLVIKLLRHYFLESAGKQIDIVLSSRLFQRMMAMRMDVFPDSVGAFASQLRDIDSIKQFFTASTLAAFIDLPFALFFLFVIYYVGGALVLAPLIAAIVIVIYGFIIHFPLKSIVEKTHTASAQKNAIVIETLSGIETLKAFNAEGRQQQFWEQSLNYLAGINLKARRLADSITVVSGFIIQAAVVATVVIGVYQIEAKSMSMGALIAGVLLCSRALAPMVQLSNLLAQFYQAKTALEAINKLTTQPTESNENRRFIQPELWCGGIEARDINFCYTDKQTALKAVSFKIKPGEKVGLIGKIGSGKSTLMRLLVGFGHPQTGQLLLDGIDISHIDSSEIRANTGYVPQEITLFRGTLRDNILLKAPYASQKALKKAAEIAGLDEFVQKHPLGFDMPIGEQGKGLSGGQKQSVAIARAVINEPKILLFDELTSAMDNQSEQAVIESMKSFSQEKTMVLSTHRASLLALVDRVVVMDEGRIIADGPKEKVLDALKRGLIQTASQVSQNV